MHKFSIIFAFISSIFPAMTYPIEACGIEVTINRNHAVRTVTCAECRTFTDFAMFGGALLSQTSAISIPVENSSGDRAVVSIQRYISHPTGANISADILRRLGLQIDLPDPDRSGITVDTVKGYVFGSRWDNRRTLDRSLEAKCNDIEKQKKEESAPAPRRGSVSEGAYDTDAYWRSGNPHDLYGGRSYERSQPRTIVRTESCGTERCPSWDAPPELVRSGVDSWYVDWQPPSRETRITTEEIRSGGGRSRSTRTNSTGLGLGAGLDPGKAKEH
jgi:hypothetical protein